MSQEIANVHDAFFKRVLSDGKTAGTLLREHLPHKIAALLSPEPPKPEFTTFVDEHLRQHHSDLLFRVRLNTGDETLAYVLFEHKSLPDPATPLQLLRYIVRILSKWYDKHQRLPLPVVLPLVLHHGPKGWQSSTQFVDLFGSVPKSLRPYLPSFRHALVDLADIDDRKLSSNLRLRVNLKTMKYVQRPELPHELGSILDPELDDEVDIKPILNYINNGPVRVSRKVIQAALRERLGRRRQVQIMKRWTDKIEERGHAKGLAEGEARGEARGEAKGEVKGEAKMLIRVLEKRFGKVTSNLRKRIFTSDIATIEAWLDRALEVKKLQSIFQSAKRS